VFSSPGERIYPIVDTDVCHRRGLDPHAVATACIRGGATILQLRVKSGSSASFLELADAVVAEARAYGVTVVVNDRADIARASCAGGVHVGQEDLPPHVVRTVLGGGLIGLSTHDERQVDEAVASVADYVAIGPIYQTGTKDTGYAARGLDLVRYAAGRGKPVVAIGGITLERAPEVIAAGASAVAVITDLLNGTDVESRVREYLSVLKSGGA
jgi:thiamine-phosphate pyrophosphorylase